MLQENANIVDCLEVYMSNWIILYCLITHAYTNNKWASVYT